MDFKDIAFVDIETTGTSAENDKVLEIAIICVSDNKIVKEYSTLLNPQMPFSPFIEMMTGIKPQDVEDAPTFEDVHHEIYDLLKDRVFIAHNVGFDYGFIKQEFKRLGLSFSLDRCCTVKLSRALYPEFRSHNLDSIIERFGFNCEQRHRAYGDTSVLWQFYQHVHKSFDTDKIQATLKLISKSPTLPQHIDKTIIDGLQEKPGVYIFYGEEGIPLYVGKSKNIKDRVLSHFANIYDSEKEKDIMNQLRTIETQETTGELGALLLESRLVKELQPIYNRQLRKCQEMTYLFQDTNKDGYYIPVLKTMSPLDVTDTSNILGIFKKKAQAKQMLENIKEEYELCKVLLGIEKSNSGCFDYKLEKCLGACLKKEDVNEYNIRLQKAFSRTRVQEWPFNDAVMIEEYDLEKRVGEKYIFKDWRYMGSVKYSEDDTFYERSSEVLFDYDMYMILKRNIQSNSSIKTVPLEKIESSYC